MPKLHHAPTRGRRQTTRRWTRTRRNVAVLGAALSLVIGGVIVAPSVSPAYAADYPSWDDVQAAKNNESAKSGEISRIEGFIAELQGNVAATQAAATAAGEAYYQAQQDYILAAARADELQTQANDQAAAADAAAQKAGEVAAQLYANGGDDTALQLFFSQDAASADDILTKLGQMDLLLEHNEATYDAAVKARNNAQSLTDLATTQQDLRDALQKEAEQKLIAAQEAQQAAEAALAEQTANLATLQAQLAALKDETTKVVASYEEGVEVARKAEEARQAAARAAAEAAAEAARQAAANNNNGGGGGGGSSSGGGGGGGGATAGSGGWVRPSGGVQTSGYGYRYSQCGNGYCASSFHAGVDLAAGCGSYIYAAHSGTVTYSGYNGGYGNYVRISNNDGSGVGTGYGHIQYGGLLVSYGQWVEAGQVIALEGNTGNSFGCHVHYEVYVNGGTTNPISFMADRGVWL